MPLLSMRPSSRPAPYKRLNQRHHRADKVRKRVPVQSGISRTRPWTHRHPRRNDRTPCHAPGGSAGDNHRLSKVRVCEVRRAGVSALRHRVRAVQGRYKAVGSTLGYRRGRSRRDSWPMVLFSLFGHSPLGFSGRSDLAFPLDPSAIASSPSGDGPGCSRTCGGEDARATSRAAARARTPNAME